MSLKFYQLLPKKLLSQLMYYISRIKGKYIKNILIYFYCSITKADTTFAEEKNPYQYKSLNDFFTRQLAQGARTIDNDPQAIVSPVDGRTAIYGNIENGQLFQAKGQQYSLAALLNNEEASQTYGQGASATLYLAPDDYHRIHAPCDCKLTKMSFCPGNKHSVAPHLLEKIPNLFVGNERLVCHFETKFGKMAVIMVGALNVSSIETVWHGVLKNQANNHYDYPEHLAFKKGDELGRFNLGSTVILCFEKMPKWATQKLDSHDKIFMGEKIATY